MYIEAYALAYAFATLLARRYLPCGPLLATLLASLLAELLAGNEPLTTSF